MADGVGAVPARSTIAAILRRHGQLAPQPPLLQPGASPRGARPCGPQQPLPTERAPFPDPVSLVVDGQDDLVCIVSVHAASASGARRFVISRGLADEPVALRPTREPAVWAVVSGQRQVATIDLEHPDAI